MHQAVDHGVGLHPASQPAVLLRRRVLRADDRGFSRVASLYQLEQEVYVGVVDVFREPLVQAQELVPRVFLQYLRVRPLGGRKLVALHEQVGEPHVPRAPAHPARLLREAAGQKALARARAALDDHVGRGLHELWY